MTSTLWIGSPSVEASIDPDLSITPPETVLHPVMVQRWECVSFVHWPCRPHDVQRHLPPGIEVDTFDGAAWVGLVPFHLTVRLGRLPSIPWLSRTTEANVRTYVRGPDGRRGIWFFSLEAARLPLVLAARGWYHLPYKWARMDLRAEGPIVRYRSLRRWPSAGPRMHMALTVGPSVPPSEETPLERFLTCRWRLYSLTPEGLAVTRVDHEPWPLHQARLVELRENLFAASRLPFVADDPIVHHSPGVEARFTRRAALLTT